MSAFLRLYAQKLLLLLALLFTALTLLIALAHFQDSESPRLLGAFSYIPPLYASIFALPALLGFVIFRWYLPSLALTGIVLLNLVWNEDYRLIPAGFYENPRTAGDKVRVMAWNVQGFFFGVDSVAASLQEGNADIMLLSEAHLGSGDKDQFLGRMNSYQTVLSEQGDAAILSRLPILASYEVELPTHQASLTRSNRIEDQTKNKKRSFLHAIVQAGNTPLHVLSVRFIAGRAPSQGLVDSIKWGFYLWQQQDREVQFFRSYVRNLQGPYVFGGDLNAIPASRTIRMLSSIASDTYMIHHQWGDFTFKTKILPSSKEKDMPVMRLDYIFASSDLKSLSAERLTEIKTSDHFPIVTEFVSPPATSGHLALRSIQPAGDI